jgi:stage II sporulation protein AA (anti-sigma F factor antagonist)
MQSVTYGRPPDDWSDDGRSPQLEIEFAMDEEHATITVRGEIDIVSAQRFAEYCEFAIANPAVRVLEIDLAEVPFMDSQGINVLVRTVRDLRPRGQVVATRPSPLVLRVLELTGVVGKGLVQVRR